MNNVIKLLVFYLFLSLFQSEDCEDLKNKSIVSSRNVFCHTIFFSGILIYDIYNILLYIKKSEKCVIKKRTGKVQ